MQQSVRINNGQQMKANVTESHSGLSCTLGRDAAIFLKREILLHIYLTGSVTAYFADFNFSNIYKKKSSATLPIKI